MSARLTTILVLVMIIAAAVVGGLLWDRLPDPVASHWNVNDEVNGYTSRFWGVFLLPMVAGVMLLFFWIIPQIDPLKANIAQFRPAFNLLIVLINAFLVYVYALTLLWNLGFTTFKMSAAMLPALGLLFIFIGYLLRRTKRNFFIGIRTPWTLSSDHVWDETHRLGAILFTASGFLTMLGALLGRYAVWFIFIPLIGSSALLVVYSYVLYRREAKA